MTNLPFYFTLFEWIGSILFVSGSFLMAHKIKIAILPWILWILGGIVHFVYFGLGTQQFGFLTSIIFGLAISILGYYQWKTQNTLNYFLQITLFYFGIFFFALSCFLTIFPIFSIVFDKFDIFLNYFPKNDFFSFIDKILNSKIEWIGNFLSISGGLIMASNHRLSWLAWIFWTLGNVLLSYLTLSNNQYGLFFLQFSFCMINIYGIYKWIWKDKIMKNKIN